MAKRILVVEDYDDIRTMMSLMLRQNGFEVLEAEDGYDAVEKAVVDRPDLIFMDLALPMMDGIDAVEAIRQHQELQDVPIIAVTAYDDFYEEKALQAGCNDVIRKPLDFDQLGALLEHYIR